MSASSCLFYQNLLGSYGLFCFITYQHFDDKISPMTWSLLFKDHLFIPVKGKAMEINP